MEDDEGNLQYAPSSNSERSGHTSPHFTCKINAHPKNCQNSPLISKIEEGNYLANTLNSYFCFAK